MTQKIKRTGTLIGLVLATILIAITSYIYFIDLKLYTSIVFGSLKLLTIIIFGIISIVLSKNILGGTITFKEAFSSYFLTIFIGNLLSTIYLVIVINFLSIETKNTLKSELINFNNELMLQNNSSQADINKAIEKSKTYDPFTLSETLRPSFNYLLRDCLIGLLVALIFRNKREIQ